MNIDQPMPAPVIPTVAQPPAPFSVQSSYDGGVRRSVASFQGTPHTTPHTTPQHQAQQQRVLKQQQPQPLANQQQQQPQQQQQQQQQEPGDPLHIDVSNMGITSLAVVVSTAHANCVKLNATGNRLTAVPRLSYFKDLRTVILSNNEISTIESGAFNGMHNLEILDLQSNRLQVVPSDAFTGCTSMKVLNLRDNKLTKAPCLTKCSVLELLLDGNAIDTLRSLPDDVGIDAWMSLRRLGVSNNKVSDWMDLRYLAAMEHLEAVDTRMNPFANNLPFEYRYLLAWLCPLLTAINGTPLTQSDVQTATSLFDDGSGGISDMVLLLDSKTDSKRLVEHLASTIPTHRQRQARSGGTVQDLQQMTSMGKKVKEMSQIVRVLHRSHMNKRKESVVKLQAWTRSILTRNNVPFPILMRLRQLTVYSSAKKRKAPSRLQCRISESVNEEAAVLLSRKQARKNYQIFSWGDNEKRLSLVPCRRVTRMQREDFFAVKIQKIVRGFIVRIRLEDIRLRYNACLTIQACWKGHRVRVTKKNNRGTFVNGIATRYLERRVAELTEENQLLQNALRVLWNDSRGTHHYVTRMKHRAATKIQSIVRMHFAKKRVRARKMKYLAYWRSYRKPVAVLQRVLRGYASRVRTNKAYTSQQLELHEKQRDKAEIQNLQKQVSMLFGMVKELAERTTAQPAAPAPAPTPVQQQQQQQQQHPIQLEEEEEEEEEQPVSSSTGMRFISSPSPEEQQQQPVSSSSHMGATVGGMGLPLKAKPSTVLNSSISAIHESLRQQQIRRQEQQAQLRSYVAGIGLSPVQRQAEDEDIYEEEEVEASPERLLQPVEDDFEEEDEFDENLYAFREPVADPHYRFNDLISPPTRAPPSPPGTRQSYEYFEDDGETSL